jgi:glycosyltransferase involved in cell wall biosynthesis
MEKSKIKYSMTVSFIVLALNEERHIEKTINTVLNATKCSDLNSFEIIMVNDGSQDRTGDLMEELASKIENSKVAHHPKNLGLGSAYMTGISFSKKEYAMIIAGDNIMPAESISAIVNSTGTSDMVLPYMSDDKFRTPLRRYGSSGFTWLVNMMSGYRIKYYNGMVVRRILFEGEKIESTGYSLMAECVLKFLHRGASYIEIGVPHGYPIKEKPNSKALRFKNLKNLFFSLLRIHKMIREQKKNT